MIAQLAPTPYTGTSSNIDVLVWVGALIVAVLILGITILLVRKRLFAKDTEEASSMLGELRKMHKSGELTTEEYDAARKALTINVANRFVPPKSLAITPEAAALPQRTALPRRPGLGEVRAEPGFDLTGAPLPTPVASPNPTPPAPPSTRPLTPQAPPRNKPGPYDRKPPS